MNYKYLITYKPPLELLDDNDIATWRKVFYFTEQECPEELDLQVKLDSLIKTYNMNKQYITVKRLDK